MTFLSFFTGKVYYLPQKKLYLYYYSVELAPEGPTQKN